jgi:cobalt-zinc-cadmium efflux system membrane fusion protein
MSAAGSPTQTTLLVPKDAVQWEGCCNIVFVQETENRYRPHKVTIAGGDLGHYAVLSGVHAGDMVVTSGSFFLKTELLKDKLGVGCTGE